jgi:hypothetical protein
VFEILIYAFGMDEVGLHFEVLKPQAPAQVWFIWLHNLYFAYADCKKAPKE